MKKRSKSKKQLEREHQLRREEKTREFTEQFYVREKRWKELGLELSWRPFSSLEEFLKKELDKWEGEQLKIPTGKFRDTKKIVSTYQQKFLDCTRQLCPEVIEELQEFVPLFERLMGEQKDKYLNIFVPYKMEIFELDSLLDNKIYLIIKDNFLRFRPNQHLNYRYDYKWGEHSLLLHFLYFLFEQKESTDKTDEILQETIQLLQNNLIIDRDYIKLPDAFDESILQKYVIHESGRIIKELLSNDELEYFRESARQKLTKFLQDISPTPDLCIVDFIELKIGLLRWAERHNLHKDWLLRYVYCSPLIKLIESE
jgi:hypothetical protein